MEHLAGQQPQTGHFVPLTPSAPVDDRRAGKHLVFRLSKEEYAIPVAVVQEILGLTDITPVPGTAPHIKGIFNVRGRVLPVVDLRMRMGLMEEPYGRLACIIVVRTRRGNKEPAIGVLVDEVLDVMNVLPEEIQDTPDFGTSAPSSHILGMARSRGRVRILLDVEEVLLSPNKGGL